MALQLKDAKSAGRWAKLMQRYGSIYVVTNTVTGEQYVGQTRQPVKRRWTTHINTATANVPKKYNLSKAIGEYGKDSFDFKEVFYAFNAEGLNAAEIELIAELKPAYNIAKGGAGHRGVVPSPELCKKRSETIKALWSNPEWKARQIAKLKQAHSTDEAKERGRRISILGTTARWANHTKKEKVIVRKEKQIKIKKDPLVVRALVAKMKWKPIFCQELNVCFLSGKHAAKHFNIATSHVSQTVKNKGKVKGLYTLQRVA